MQDRYQKGKDEGYDSEDEVYPNYVEATDDTSKSPEYEPTDHHLEIDQGGESGAYHTGLAQESLRLNPV
jgi:hypothetical protein